VYTKQQLRKILANWNVPNDVEIEEVSIADGTKTFDSVWKIGDEYYLKRGKPAQLLKNSKIAKALAGQGFQSALPVTTRTGAEYLSGKEVFALTKTMVGSPLPKPELWGERRIEYAFKYGKSIAELHNALAAIERDIQPDEINLFTHISEWALPEVKRQNSLWNIGLPNSFFDEYSREIGAMFENLPKQIIHRDPHPGNILFDGDSVSGFIDFDIAERNIRLWDACYCATGIFSERRGVDDILSKWLDIFGGIVRGYDSVNTLTPDEYRSVWHIICAIQMVCVAFFGANDEYRELAEANREALLWAVEHKAEIKRVAQA
jgi:Ser/Thr protein kinase RdoA (MazF antagonist)